MTPLNEEARLEAESEQAARGNADAPSAWLSAGHLAVLWNGQIGAGVSDALVCSQFAQG